MRRSLSLAVLFALIAPLAVVPAASAATAPITVRWARNAVKGWSSQIEVSVLAAAPVNRLSVALRIDGGSTTPYATLSDFQLVGGTSTDGTWESVTAADLPLDPTDIDVSVADSAGDQVSVPVAGTIGPHVPTTFASFSVTPTTIGVDRAPVAFSGRLVYSDAKGVTQPVTGATVNVISNAGRTTVTTNAAGDFSGTAPAVTAPSDYRAVSAPLGGLMGMTSARIPVTVEPFPSRVTDLTVNPAQPYRNQSVTISGRLEYQDPSGTWRPAPNSWVYAAPVGVDPANYLHDFAFWATSASNGSFQFNLDYVPESGAWAITHDPKLNPWGPVSTFDPYAASDSVAQVADPAHLMFQTSIVLQGTSSPCGWVVKGRPTNLLGGLSGTPVGEPITLQFSPDGKTWTNTPFNGTSGVETQSYVNFSIPVDFTQTGWWRASYAGSSHALPAVSAPFPVTVGAQYRVFASVDQGLPATPGTEVYISGGVDGCSPTGYIVGQKGDPILLQYSTDGTTWKTVQTTSIYATDGSGSFASYVQVNATGYWRAYAAKFKTAGAPILITVKRADRFTGLSVSQTPGRHGRTIHLKGTLLGSLHSWYALSGQKVQVFFRAKGAKTTTQIGVVTTGKTGAFTFTTRSRQPGTYWFTYPGSGLYWPVTSRGITASS